MNVNIKDITIISVSINLFNYSYINKYEFIY